MDIFFIENFCELNNIESYKINPFDGSIDVDGDVHLRNVGNSRRIPVKFNRVSGDFNCGYIGLDTLINTPNFIGGSFMGSNNRLTSLENFPNVVTGDIDCAENSLTSLKGCPSEVNGEFNVSRNDLVSLEFCPRLIYGNFYAYKNQIKTLEFMPKVVGGIVDITHNLISLLDPKFLSISNTFRIAYNRLTLSNFNLEILYDIHLRNEHKKDWEDAQSIEMDKEMLDYFFEYVVIRKRSDTINAIVA